MVKPHGESGLSVTELLSASTILGVVLTGVFSFYRSQLYTTWLQETAVNLKEGADAAVDMITKEVRLAGARPERRPDAGCPTVPVAPQAECSDFERISVARADRIDFQYDFRGADDGSDADGCPDDPLEQVSFSYAVDPSDPSTGSIRRAVNGSTASSVTRRVAAGDFTLEYRDGANNPLTPDASGALTAAQRADVSVVVVTISTSAPHPDPAIGGKITSTRQGTIFLRNPEC